MNQRNTPPLHSFISKINSLRISIAIAVAALVVLPLFTVSSASLSQQFSPGNLSNAAATSSRPAAVIVNPIAHREAAFPFMPFLQAEFIPESVATYASDCTTPQETFAVGETACAKAFGTLLRPGRIYWVNSQGEAVKTDIIGPTSPTSTWIVTATGNWKVYLSDFDSLRASAPFGASDPQVPAVDLSVWNNVGGTEFLAGSLVEYKVALINNGPDAASSVVLTQTIPNNATLISSSQDGGPAFACTDSAINTSCTLGSLASGASASFNFIYQLTSGTPAGTLIANTATISSTTGELHAPDNSSSSEATIKAGAAPASCVLDCPNNITTAANTTQAGVSGANVAFANAEGFGDCDAISPDRLSGSFFPVGVTNVLVTSATGGGSCSFSVTVLATAPPTISCPSDQSVTAPANSSEAAVDPGAPTTNPTAGVSVSGVRSDSGALNAPYPVGTTFITWTATNTDGLSSSCTQRITVSSDACGTDTVNPSIVAPDDVSVTIQPNTVDSCGAVVGETALGTANATDNCTVTVTRSAIPAGNFFPVGTTIITYTATDGAGLTATDTQTVTVVDGSAPVIVAPADAIYVCPSEVPEKHPSQATRGTILDGNGNPLPPGPPFDNCGTPAVTVTESNNGGAGSAGSPMVITRIFTATDAAGNSSSDTQTITVADGVAPTITAPVDASYQCASAVPGGSASDASASDNCATPTVAFSEANNGGAGTTVSPLIITRTYTATDAAGNSASDSQTITVVDNTAPTVTAPADASFQCASNVPAGGAGDATASDNCGAPTVTYSESSSGAGSTASPLVITRTYTATDAAGNSASDSQTITVVDTTAPSLTVPAATTASADNSCQAGIPNVVLGSTASDNCAGSVSVTQSPTAGTLVGLGSHTITVTATDAAGNTTTATTGFTVNDTTAPVLSCPANIVVNLPANSPATSMAVSFAAPTATDNCSVPTVASSAASGSVFPVGTTTVTATATDAAGNQSSCAFTITVLYNFTGFFSPVGNVPTLNSVNAGRAIPVKFSLSGNKGLGIFADNSPYTVSLNCDNNDPGVDVTETLTAGGSSLSYNSGSDQYHYTWKTENSWAGTCRQLVVKLNDGSTHVANFKFK